MAKSECVESTSGPSLYVSILSKYGLFSNINVVISSLNKCHSDLQRHVGHGEDNRPAMKFNKVIIRVRRVAACLLSVSATAHALMMKARTALDVIIFVSPYRDVEPSYHIFSRRFATKWRHSSGDHTFSTTRLSSRKSTP